MTDTRALFICDKATVPPEIDAQRWSHRHFIRSSGDSPDVNFRAQSLAATVLTDIVGTQATDLVQIASYVYAADQMVSRGSQVDVYGQKWRRKLALCIPVAEPEYWSRPELQTKLRDVLAFLTEDEWEFHFSKSPSAVRQIPLELHDQELLESPNTVVLLSGGVDSLCTAIESFVSQDRRPVFVSHRPEPVTSSRQRALTSKVRERFPEWGFPHLSFWIHRRGSDATDTNQRSRAFLFTSLGAAVASELRIDTVLLGDNGIVSLNLPISGQLIGAMASRSTHPRFIHRMNQFLQEVFRNDIRIQNPLAQRTRAETLRTFLEHDCADLLLETNSCSRPHRRPAETPHCGYCSQCVDRRFGILAAGMEQFDPVDRYEVDVFTSSLREGEPRTIAESYVRFAQTVEECDADQLFHEFPQMFDALLPDVGRIDEAASSLVRMIKQHAEDVLTVTANMIAQHKYRLAARQLPDDCLLRLIAGPRIHAPREPTQEEFVFRRDGHHWTLTYQGLTQRLRDSKGLRYMARLISHPGREFHALDLYRDRPAHEGPAVRSSTGTALAGTDQIEPGLSMNGANTADEVLDPEARRQIRRELARLEARQEQLSESGHPQLAADIENEIRDIERELIAGTGLAGRSRQLQNPAEKARKSVSTAINRAKSNIADVHPALFRHLDASVRTGAYCSYQHHPPPNWKTWASVMSRHAKCNNRSV